MRNQQCVYRATLDVVPTVTVLCALEKCSATWLQGFVIVSFILVCEFLVSMDFLLVSLGFVPVATSN
jgi:hypothetical protein